MSTSRLPPPRKLLLVLLVVAPAAVWIGQQVTLANAKKEATKMAHEIGEIKMQTVCVGRFLIDVPADAQISFRPAFLAGWGLKSNVEETEAAFAERLNATEQKHKATKNERGGTSLESIQTVNSEGVSGKVFVYGRDWVHGFEEGKRIDSTFVAVDASVRINGVSFDFAREIGRETDVKRLLQFISQLEARTDGSIPHQPGFCFEDGFLRDPLTAAQNERVAVFVGLKDHPDVAIVANTMAGLEPGPGLLQRDDENHVKQSNRSNFKTLRRGARSLAGIPGEEVLDLVIEPTGTRSQDFMWESLSQKDSVFMPELILEMNTGHGQPGSPINSSLTDAKALALWDRISSSLRLRPTRDANAEARLRGNVPLGTLSLASDKCTQSGWWECTDGTDRVDIVGGRRQYFTEGQVFPQAVLLTPGTVWQNFRGERPTFTSSVPSTWKLTDRRKAKRNAAVSFLAKSLQAPEGSAPATPDAHRIGEVATGTEVTSAMACPASGWWKCSEAKAFDGTRWFGRGDAMPPATMPAAISLVEKMKGVPEFVRVSTRWRLVRRAEAISSSVAIDRTSADSEQVPAPAADNSPTTPTEDA